jgi:hypothetical protein
MEKVLMMVKHVSWYCNMGNNVATPIDIVRALSINGGFNIFIAE